MNGRVKRNIVKPKMLKNFIGYAVGYCKGACTWPSSPDVSFFQYCWGMSIL
jgi:hypothetical protein